jgi:DNA-binding MarR family transcriptional regulator/GNAT superfamily N-acetyltransferase
MTEQSEASEEEIVLLRSFNRTYTRQIGLLNEGLLKSLFTLTEARILYDLACRDALTATDLRRELGLDAGYLSRILNAFAKNGLVARSPSPGDARQSLLELTAAGRAAYEPLNRASHDEIAGMLNGFTPHQRRRLVAAMASLREILGDAPQDEEPYILRPHRPGDMGWIVRRQAVLYAEEYGWDESFEALIAEIAAAFLDNFDAAGERCWIAERNGEIVGSVFVVRQTDDIAKLRLLYVEASARGLGIGSRLVGEAIRFSRDAVYRMLKFWTNDILVSARRIYEAAGFRLVSEEPHHSFGKDLVGQTWEMKLWANGCSDRRRLARQDPITSSSMARHNLPHSPSRSKAASAAANIASSRKGKERKKVSRV